MGNLPRTIDRDGGVAVMPGFLDTTLTAQQTILSVGDVTSVGIYLRDDPGVAGRTTWSLDVTGQILAFGPFLTSAIWVGQLAAQANLNLINRAGGLILGDITAIRTYGGTTTIDNSGRIEGVFGDVINGFDSVINITNRATGQIVGYTDGIVVDGNSVVTINNFGLISNV